MPSPSSSSDIITPIQLLRSSVASKRPNPSLLLDGQPAININLAEPGLYFSDSDNGELVKIGPCFVGSDPPNSDPAGYAGNCKGEFWLDTTSESNPLLKIWDGSSWITTGSGDPGPGGDYIENSIIAAKGDLIVGQSNDNPSILAIGDTGECLFADPSEPLGMKWAPLPTTDSIQNSIIDAKGDLIVGSGPNTPDILPLGDTGEYLVADPAEPLGMKWAAAPVPPTPTVETLTFTTASLNAGSYQDFNLDFGTLFFLISAGTTTPSSAWIRGYTTSAGRSSDTRTLPGAPYPCASTGFAAEAVTSLSVYDISFVPVPAFYTTSGMFFRVTNTGVSPSAFTVTFKYTQVVP